MVSRVAAMQIDMENHSSTSVQIIDTREVTVCQKANQTIQAQIKQIIVSKTGEKNWKIIEEKLRHPPYKAQQNIILEKLDDNDHYAALHYAVLSNDLRMCEILIKKHKCNVNVVGKYGQTPIHLAAARSIPIEKDTERNENLSKNSEKMSNSVLEYLLKQSEINISTQDNQKRTPLHYAIMNGCWENVKLLIEKNQTKGKWPFETSKSILEARRNLADIQGAVPIHYACRYGADAEIFGLLNSKPDSWFTEKTHDGTRPVDLAAEYGHLHILKKYVQDEKNRKGIGILAYAAVRRGNLPQIAKVFPNTKYPGDILHAACRQRHAHDSVSFLLNTEKDKLGVTDQDGYTPLMISVKYRRLECVQALLGTGQCTETVFSVQNRSQKYSVFHICAEIQHAVITDILFDVLKNLRNIKDLLIQKDTMGNTPLHICAQNGNEYMCQKVLIIYKSLPRSIPGYLPIWLLKNFHERTPFQEALHHSHPNIVHLMLNRDFIPDTIAKARTKMIHGINTERQTNLHVAASKGNFKIVRLLIKEKLDVNALDMDDNTPLHHAVRSITEKKKEINEQFDWIDYLIENGADINARNIRWETPLHYASRYGSFRLVEDLVEHNADLLVVNIDGFNSFEVAIDTGNKEVVKYFLEHDRIFDMMRNAQLSNSLPNTPMRKLILNMPDMALCILDKCTTNLNTEASGSEKIFYSYEFFDDEYFIHDWAAGKKQRMKTNTNGPYRKDYMIIVENHPLFLMAKYNRMKLMAHPLSQKLATKKFRRGGRSFFYICFLFYGIFLGLFTTFALRIKHPQFFYQKTNFTFDNRFCENVAQKMNEWPADDFVAKKTNADRILKCILSSFLLILLLKNFWITFGLCRVHATKILTVVLEIGTIILCFFFICDWAYQKEIKMRCPTQWQCGAFGLFLGYLSLLYYLQHIPIIGVYIVMLKILILRFTFFLPVLACLIVAFGIAFHMLFAYEIQFKNFAVRALSQIVIMMTGELGFSETMFDNDDDENSIKPYYKLTYVMYILFAFGMVIFVTNLLISLAVGEIVPLMNRAKEAQVDMKFELIADYEILRLQARLLLCHFVANQSELMDFYDKKNISFWQKRKNCIVNWCTHTTYIDEEIFQSAYEIEDKDGKQIELLSGIKGILLDAKKFHGASKESNLNKQLQLNFTK